MKYLLYLIPFSLLFGCVSTDDGKHDAGINTRAEQPITLEELVKQELLTGDRHDTIFGGFRFRMNSVQVSRHASQLKKKKKLIREEYDKGDSQLKYLLVTNDGTKYRTSFGMQYEGRGLYTLTITVPPSKEKPENASTISKKLKNTYVDKYGTPDITRQTEDFPSCNDYIWVNGNLQITISCADDNATIFYKDNSRDEAFKEWITTENEKVRDDI